MKKKNHPKKKKFMVWINLKSVSQKRVNKKKSPYTVLEAPLPRISLYCRKLKNIRIKNQDFTSTKNINFGTGNEEQRECKRGCLLFRICQ